MLCGEPTRRAPRPGRWPCHGHGRYRHCSRKLVSKLIVDGLEMRVDDLCRCVSMHCCCRRWTTGSDIPDGENAASLGKASLLLDTADPLLEDGRDLGGRGLRVGGVGAGLYRGSVDHCGCGISSLCGGRENHVSRNPNRSRFPTTPNRIQMTGSTGRKAFPRQPCIASPINWTGMGVFRLNRTGCIGIFDGIDAGSGLWSWGRKDLRP